MKLISNIKKIKTSEKKPRKFFENEFINELKVSVTLYTRTKRVKTRARSSNKERRVDALALRAEERRDKLRKAAGRCK